jgi:hypothetical protein
MKYISPLNWEAVLRLWPAVLIIIGLDILFGRRSLVGAIFSSLFALLIVGGLLWLLLTGPHKISGFDWLTSTNLVLQTKEIKTPLEDTESARVNIDWGTGIQTLDVLPETSPNLLEGKVEYYKEFIFDAKNENKFSRIDIGASFVPEKWLVLIGKPTDWQISLHPGVMYDLNMNSIAGKYDFDLRNLHLNHLKLDFTTGSCNLDLPTGDYDVNINMTSGDMNISIPKDMEARVYLNHTSGNFSLESFKLIEGKKDGDGTWETTNYASAEKRTIFNVDMTSGNMSIKTR